METEKKVDNVSSDHSNLCSEQQEETSKIENEDHEDLRKIRFHILSEIEEITEGQPDPFENETKGLDVLYTENVVGKAGKDRGTSAESIEQTQASLLEWCRQLKNREDRANQISTFSLRFHDQELENGFDLYYWIKHIDQMRYSMSLLAIVIFFLGIYDYFAHSETESNLFFIKIAVRVLVSVALLIFLLFTKKDCFSRHYQTFSGAVFSTLCVLWITTRAADESESSFTYLSFVVLVNGLTLFCMLRFIAVLCLCVISVVGFFAFVLFRLNKRENMDKEDEKMIWWGFSLTACAILYIIAGSRMFEVYKRKQFLFLVQMREENKLLIEENRELRHSRKHATSVFGPTPVSQAQSILKDLKRRVGSLITLADLKSIEFVENVLSISNELRWTPDLAGLERKHSLAPVMRDWLVDTFFSPDAVRRTSKSLQKVKSTMQIQNPNTPQSSSESLENHRNASSLNSSANSMSQEKEISPTKSSETTFQPINFSKFGRRLSSPSFKGLRSTALPKANSARKMPVLQKYISMSMKQPPALSSTVPIFEVKASVDTLKPHETLVHSRKRASSLQSSLQKFQSATSTLHNRNIVRAILLSLVTEQSDEKSSQINGFVSETMESEPKEPGSPSSTVSVSKETLESIPLSLRQLASNSINGSNPEAILLDTTIFHNVPEPIKQLSEILQNKFLDWNFPTMEVSNLCQNHPLVAVSLNLFLRRELIQRCNLPEDKLIEFLTRIEAGYRDVPYHNCAHAAEVTHSIHYLVSQICVLQSVSEWEWLAALVAAIIHDFEHPGLNNAFQIAASTSIAMLYNDSSPLENHHIAAAYAVLSRDDSNIFKSTNLEKYREVRKQIIAMVLDTDLKHHFESLGRFKTMISKGIDSESTEDKLILMSMALKCADVSHSAKEWSMHCDWSSRVLEEFFLQGDKEKEMGLPVSPLCDRNTTEVAKSQAGFIKYLVQPMYEAYCTHFIDELSDLVSTKGLSLSRCESEIDNWLGHNLRPLAKLKSQAVLETSLRSIDEESVIEDKNESLHVSVVDLSPNQAEQSLKLLLQQLTRNLEQWEHDQGVGKMLPGMSSSLNVHYATKSQGWNKPTTKRVPIRKMASEFIIASPHVAHPTHSSKPK